MHGYADPLHKYMDKLWIHECMGAQSHGCRVMDARVHTETHGCRIHGCGVYDGCDVGQSAVEIFFMSKAIGNEENREEEEEGEER